MASMSEAPCAAEEATPEECRSPAPRKTAVRHLVEEESGWRQLRVAVRHLAEEDSASEHDGEVVAHAQPDEDMEQGGSARRAEGAAQDTVVAPAATAATDAGDGGRIGGWWPPSSRMYVGGTFMPRSPRTLAMPAKAPSSADGLEAGLLQRAARAVICGLQVANAIQASEGEESRETKETTLQADEEIWSASRPTTSASGEEWSASRPTTSASAFDASRPTTSASAASAGSVNSQGRRITEKEKQRLEKKEEDKRRRAELRRQAEEAEEQRKRDEAERLRLLQEEAERGVDYVYSGARDENGLPDGMGRVLYKETGLVYEGEFRNGAAQGEGKLLWPNGSVYVGVVHDGKPVQGLLDKADGETLYYRNGVVVHQKTQFAHSMFTSKIIQGLGWDDEHVAAMLRVYF